MSLEIENGRNKDTFYDYFQEPTREKLTELLFNNVGEQNYIDFKEIWIEEHKLAKIILGIANSGGGAIIFGVRENEDGTFNSIGLSKFYDKAVVQGKLESYLPDTLLYNLYDYDYRGEEYSKLKDKKFQVLVIQSEDKDLPYICAKSSEILKEGVIYIRRGTTTEPINSEELQRLISKRVDTVYSNTSELRLIEHLSQLKVLYEHIEKKHTIRTNKIIEAFSLFNPLGTVRVEDNPLYPEEDYENFIVRMIEEKKLKIEKVLDIK